MGTRRRLHRSPVISFRSSRSADGSIRYLNSDFFFCNFLINIANFGFCAILTSFSRLHLQVSIFGIDSYGNQTLYQTQCKFRDSYFQCKVKAVRLGQNTASFKNYRLPMLEHLSFSLVLGCHRTLDITCKDEYEVVYSLWSFIHLMPWRSDLTPEDISPPKNQDVDGNFLLLQISS